MGLDFGWRVNDKHETVWKGDAALVDVPAGVLDDWQRDGGAVHLLPYAKNGQPEVFTFRALNIDEKRLLQGLYDEESSGYARMILACFRIGVEFPGASEEYKRESTGQSGFRLWERVRGVRMLSEPFVAALEAKYPGMVEFYGSLIFNATFPSEPEKKASSPQSTKTPSSAAGTSMAGTVDHAKPEGAAA